MILAISVVAVLLLIGLAWAMGFRSRPSLDEAAARDEAEGRLAGFRATHIALARDGRGAVLRGADGTLALVLPFGDSWLSRKLPQAVPISHQDGLLRVKLDEPMLAEASLPLERLPAWLQEGAA